MDGTIIAFFGIVVGIPVLAGTGHRIFKRWADLREKQLDQAAHLAADRAAAQATHLERLEARMRVLERIATDKSALVAEEIERLRDDRTNGTYRLGHEIEQLRAPKN